MFFLRHFLRRVAGDKLCGVVNVLTTHLFIEILEIFLNLAPKKMNTFQRQIQINLNMNLIFLFYR